MKFVFWLILTLGSSLLTTSLQARHIRVLYYPATTDPLTFAYSPDATDSSQGSNPTLTIQPGTTVEIPIPDGVRFWWWTPGHGWVFGPASTDPDIACDLLLDYSAGSYSYSIPRHADESRITNGMLLAFFSVFVLVCGYKLGKDK